MAPTKKDKGGKELAITRTKSASIDGNGFLTATKMLLEKASEGKDV